MEKQLLQEILEGSDTGTVGLDIGDDQRHNVSYCCQVKWRLSLAVQ